MELYNFKKNNPEKSRLFLYPRPDSNRHILGHLILSQARLPIPPLGQRRGKANKKMELKIKSKKIYQSSKVIKHVNKM